MTSETKRKNVLLILTDQQRWDSLGCYGAPLCRTPHIDGLAERGVRFDAAYTPTSPCSPARAALFTGLYPHKNNVPTNGGYLNQEVPNLAGELQQAGYQLGYAGKWHVDQGHVPTQYGFEGHDFPGYGYPIVGGVIEGVRYGSRWNVPTPIYQDYLDEHGLETPELLEATYGENPGKQDQEMYALHSGGLDHSFEAMVADEAMRLMGEFAASEDDAPFFVWANFWGPHTPCLLPEPYYSMYDPADVPPEPSFAETWADKPHVHDLVERFWGLTPGGWEGWRELIARYWGYCTMIDDLVGRLLEKLRDLGLEDDTVVIYTTDHGDMMGAHRLLEKGPFAYEESWRLPFIAAHPDVEHPGSVCDEFVYLHDLYPTILEMAGAQPPDVPDSQSILDNVLGRDVSTGRDSVYCAFTAQLFPFPFRFVRTHTHKLVYNQVSIGELYNLQDDPWELRNLIDAPQERETKEALLEAMAEHMRVLGDPMLDAFERIRHMY